MTESMPFGDAYAGAYDAVYAGKDYAGECDAVERAFGRADGPVRRVLDLGCGTGRHAVLLARRGYAVTGVDVAPAMLAQARARAADEPGLPLDFHEGDLRDLDGTLGPPAEPYDAVVVLFAVLGYLTTNADLRAALAGIRRRLRPGGVLVFDGWYGPGVLADPPGERVRTFETDAGTVLRAARGTLDVRHHTCAVDYRLWTLAGDRVVAYAEESHRMRFFFPMEVEALLDGAGFAPLALGAFPDLDRAPDAATWTFLAAAQAVSRS